MFYWEYRYTMKKMSIKFCVIVCAIIGIVLFYLNGLDYKLFYHIHKDEFAYVGTYMINNDIETIDTYRNELPHRLNDCIKRISMFGKILNVRCYKASRGECVFFDFNGSTAIIYYPMVDVEEVKSTVVIIHDDYKNVSQLSNDWYYTTKIGA